METGYVLALLTGVLGGFGHCIGMCGPLVASYALKGAPDRRSLLQHSLPHILYNSGRITTYALIGGLMGLSGSFVNVAGRMAGIQNAVAVLSGLLMIAMGLSIAGIWSGAGLLEQHNSGVLRLAKKLLHSPSPYRYYPLGLLLGLLPCGLSYTVFIAAAGTGGPAPGTLTGLAFGIGTLPALLLFGLIISSLGASLRGRIYRAGGWTVVLMGIYFVYRGVRLYADL